jgi:hypothetical protein
MGQSSNLALLVLGAALALMGVIKAQEPVSYSPSIAREAMNSAMRGRCRRRLSPFFAVSLVFLIFGGTLAKAQTTLASAVDSALQNSPRVKLAEDDLQQG